MRRLTKQFSSDDRGNLAIMFGFLLTVLLLVAAIATDYGVAVNRKKLMDAAVDIALLTGTKAAGEARALGKEDWAAIGAKTARTAFTANLPPQTNFTSLTFEPNFALDKNEVFGTATYTGKSRAALMSVFGTDSVPFNGLAKARVAAGNFVDINFVVDNSMSMGLGAELADQTKMYDATIATDPWAAGCALACHYQKDQRALTSAGARAIGAKLRIDVVREAVVAAIADIQKTHPATDQVRIGIHTFSNDLKTLKSPTANLAEALTAAKAIDLDSSTNGGGTLLSYALYSLNANLKRGGDGTTAINRKSFVVLLTDGLENSARMGYFFTHPYTQERWHKNFGMPGLGGNADPEKWFPTEYEHRDAGGSHVEPLNPEPCAALKSQTGSGAGNHNVMAIQISYTIGKGMLEYAPGKAILNKITGVWETPLADAFKSCVSQPDYTSVAKTTADIAPSMKALVSKITKPAQVFLSH